MEDEDTADELMKVFESAGFTVTTYTITEGVIMCIAIREDDTRAEVAGSSVRDGLMRLAEQLGLEVCR